MTFYSSDCAALLNTTTAAQLLKISPRTLEAWRLKNKGPGFIRLGGAVRYSAEDLDQYIAANRYSAEPPARPEESKQDDVQSE